MKIAIIALALVAQCFGDMYLHNMRGSNNRLDEANRDRNNANRLFDSQNNNRGGYNVGSLYFYEGEKIPFEWTNQHGCGNEWNDCQIVLQYMCDDDLRDGTTTNTIPEQPSNCHNNDCNRDIRFGMHEDYDYWMNCKYRYRNRGLFTADRNLQGNTARFTRQNENGNRRGYECSEERDYFPYWAPSPWVDIAILVDDPSRCDYYRAESENIKGRYFCSLPDNWYHSMIQNGGNGNNGFIPATYDQCMALNSATSPMITFQKQQVAAQTASLSAVANSQYSQCLSALSAGPLNVSMTLDQLTTLCPQCQSGWVPHPNASCAVCIPTSCASALVAVNMTAFSNNSGCPPGLVLDVAHFNPSICIPSTCVAGNETTSYTQMYAVDTCRANALVGNNLVDGNGACLRRPVVSGNCGSLGVLLAQWKQQAAHNQSLTFLDPSGPICTQNLWSRPNHLGNGYGGHQNGFNFTFPPQYAESCSMRIRYNITTSDYGGLDPMDPGQVNATLNRGNNDNGNTRVNIAAMYDIPTTDSAAPYRNARGYNLRQNPNVQVFDYWQIKFWCASNSTFVPGDPTKCYRDSTKRTTQNANTGFCPRTFPILSPAFGPAAGQTGAPTCTNSTGATGPAVSTTDQDFKLQLAINTNQFGRTFQDRSHKFAMRQRPPELSINCGDIYALNVRGKRGNIVQVYPGTEYDYTPEVLNIAEGDCVHFQWTGSNTNPENNDGQGRAGTDRHNVAQQMCVRGMGGLSLAGPGGFGAGGTTWTTANLEPGFQGWVQSASPSMADVQCPVSSPVVHPYNWKFCIQPSCTFVNRPFNQVVSNGVRYNDYLACPAGYAPDNFNTAKCLSTACNVIARPPNPAQFTSGLDPFEPDFPGYNASQIGVPNALKHGCWGTSFPEHLDNVTMLGFSRLDLQHLAILDNMQFGGNMKQFDDAGTYFDLGVRKVSQVGTYHYMCTRNNNFSNRSQKGKIVVLPTPEQRVLVGSTGGNLGISTSQSYTPAQMSNQSVIANSDYLISVPPNCVTSATPITMATMPSPGNLASASNFVLISPPSLACLTQLSQTNLQVNLQGTRATGILISGNITAQVTIINASAVSFEIWGDGFKAFFNTWVSNGRAGNAAYQRTPFTKVQFWSADRSIVSPLLTEYFTGQYKLADDWPNMDANAVRAFEAGNMYIGLFADGFEYQGKTEVVAGTSNSITIRIPVSITVQYGSVYYYPDTPQGAACALGQMDSSLCSQLRQAVSSAVISDGAATFQVGGSTTNPAGGYYHVTPGSNIAVIIGVTVACVVAALAAVGSAIYFRKHPDKWSSAKEWGPRRYKALQRSCASYV